MIFIGIFGPKILALLAIWIPPYEQSSKLLLSLICGGKLLWDYGRCRPGHKGLPYRLVARFGIDTQEIIVCVITFCISLLFGIMTICNRTWIPAICGIISVAFSLFDLVISIKDAVENKAKLHSARNQAPIKAHHTAIDGTHPNAESVKVNCLTDDTAEISNSGQPSSDLEGTMVGEKYHLYKCISKGGVSSTYLAIDQLTSDMHIVKVVESNSSNADIIGRLEKTFNLQSCLSHPAIPKAEALIRAGNFTCFVFEDLQGQTLDVVRKEYGTIDFYTLTDWAVQLCDVLQYLHSQNPQCLLRGLCPSNILLQPDGRLRLIDFPGMLTALNGRVDLQQLGFTAPERFAGNDDVRADIFSLGMVLHNLATGVDTAQPPYIAGPIREHRPDVPHWFEKIVEKCIEADPKNRFQNCDEMVLCLSKHHPTEAD